MPLPEGTRYRWKTYSSGKKVRLAFKKGSNKVIEVKSAQTGEKRNLESKAKGRKLGST